MVTLAFETMVITLRTMTKRSSVFEVKSVTPSVTAPGDTNLSDGTDFKFVK